MNDFLLEANQKQILFKSRVIQDSNVYLQKCMTLLEQSVQSFKGQNVSECPLLFSLQHAVIIYSVKHVKISSLFIINFFQICTNQKMGRCMNSADLQTSLFSSKPAPKALLMANVHLITADNIYSMCFTFV